MKKVIVLPLVLVLSLSLCACGGSNDTHESTIESTTETTVESTVATTVEATVATTENTILLDKNDVSNYIGVWKSANYAFTFNKGGIGRCEVLMEGYTNHRFDFTYEVRDEAIVILRDGLYIDERASFELNDDGTALSVIQHDLSYAIGNQQYIKQ